MAAACGFADQSHFTRSFRAEYGSTPAAWLAGFKTHQQSWAFIEQLLDEQLCKK